MKLSILNLLILFSLVLGSNAYAMPKKICVKDEAISVLQTLRLRAKLVYLDENGQSHSRGDIYKDYVQKFIVASPACFNTKDLIDAFNKKGLSKKGYYFSDVRVDIKGERDCNLSGNNSIHSWIDAPRTGTINFKYKYYKLFNIIEVTGCKRSD